MTETVSGPYSAYEIHSKMAALACFQLLDGLSQDYCQQHKCNSAELILHEFYCAAYCIEHSFLNAGGSPMGRKFLQEVA